MAGDIEGGTAVLRDVLARLGMWMPSSRLATVVSIVFFRAVLLLRGMRYVLRDAGSVPARRWSGSTSAGWWRASSASAIRRWRLLRDRLLLLALRYAEPNVLSGALALEAAFLSAEGVRTRPRTESFSHRQRRSPREFGPLGKGWPARGCADWRHTCRGGSAEALDLNDCATARTARDGARRVLRHAPDAALLVLGARRARRDQGALGRASRALSGRPRIATTSRRSRFSEGTVCRRLAARRRLESVARQRERNDEAWAKSGYNGHHHFACSALAQVDLYEARGQDADSRAVAEDFPARGAPSGSSGARPLPGRDSFVASPPCSRPRRRVQRCTR